MLFLGGLAQITFPLRETLTHRPSGPELDDDIYSPRLEPDLLTFAVT